MKTRLFLLAIALAIFPLAAQEVLRMSSLPDSNTLANTSRIILWHTTNNMYRITPANLAAWLSTNLPPGSITSNAIEAATWQLMTNSPPGGAGNGNATNFWGQLSPTNYNAGAGASASTFLRGDGTWQTPAGSSASTGILAEDASGQRILSE